jgi:hypothetical protein
LKSPQPALDFLLFAEFEGSIEVWGMGQMRKKMHSKLCLFLNLIFEVNEEGPKYGTKLKATAEESESQSLACVRDQVIQWVNFVGHLASESQEYHISSLFSHSYEVIKENCCLVIKTLRVRLNFIF